MPCVADCITCYANRTNYKLCRFPESATAKVQFHAIVSHLKHEKIAWQQFQENGNFLPERKNSSGTHTKNRRLPDTPYLEGGSEMLMV